MGWNRRKLRDQLQAQGAYPLLLLGPLCLLLALTVGLVLRSGARAALPEPRPLRGSLPYATLLCRFAGSDESQIKGWPVSYYDRLMAGGPEGVDTFWRQVSYGAIDLTGSKAFGWFRMAKPAQDYRRSDEIGADLDGLARDCVAAAEGAGEVTPPLADFAGINLVFSECVGRPRGGAVDLTFRGRTREYRVTWLCPGYASSHQIVAHEIGHSFGLTHSEDDRGLAYGNNWDLMSNAGYCAATTDVGVLAQQPIAYDKDVLGWIPPGDKYTAGRSRVVAIQLDDLEQSRSSPSGFLLGVIPLPGGRFYTIEARGRTGYDVALPSAGVLIHEVDPRRDNRARLVKGRPAVGRGALLSTAGGWPVGSAFIDRENNVGVSVDQAVEHGFVVTLYTGPLPWPETATYVPSSGPGAVELQWQPAPGARRYEVSVVRAGDPAPGVGWGATFVSDRPTVEAALPPGLYRWQVRALPDGAWSPPQTTLAAPGPAWQPAQQVALLGGALRVAPLVSARDSGKVEIAWAYDEPHRAVSISRAAWQGNTWAVEDFLDLPSSSRRDLALSFTPAGDLRLAWPGAAVNAAAGNLAPAVALDAGGRAHTIWAGAGRGARGIFSAIIDTHPPPAGPEGGSYRAQKTPPASAVKSLAVADGTAADKYSPALALDGDGNAQAVWVEARAGRPALYTAAQRSGGEWGLSRRLSRPDQAVSGQPSVAVTMDGHAYAAWKGYFDCGGPTPLVEISFAERPADGAWQPALTLAVTGELVSVVDPVVAANDAGETFVAWGELQDGAYRLYAAYRGKTGQWASPQVVAEGRTDASAMTLSLAVGPRGDAYLTWADLQAGGGAVNIAATR